MELRQLRNFKNFIGYKDALHLYRYLFRTYLEDATIFQIEKKGMTFK